MSPSGDSGGVVKKPQRFRLQFISSLAELKATEEKSCYKVLKTAQKLAKKLI